MRPIHAWILLVSAVGIGLLALGGTLLARSLDTEVYGPFPLPSSIAYGPHPDDVPVSEANRVSREIIRTDRILADADGRVTRGGNDKAKEDLKSSHERQGEARAAAAQALYARATRLTLEARAYAKSALIKVGPAENDPEIVARALEQTDDALHRAKDVLEDGAGVKPRRRYEALRDAQEEARRLYKSGLIRSAYTQTREVRDGVLDMLRRCADLPVSKDVAKKALKRAEEAMTQTRKEMGARPGPGARRLERDATLQLEKARAAFGRKSYRDALLHAKLVERHLQRAMDLHRLATAAQSG